MHIYSIFLSSFFVQATAELERVFEKAWFKDMTIVGQFNLGFIVTRLGVSEQPP